MAGAVPGIVVLALGAGALGGPDALRLLVALAAGRNPVVDISICVFVIGMFAAQLLGILLLARFLRKTPPAAGGGGAGARRGAPGAAPPAADPLACITLLLSLAAASVVTACLVVAAGGDLGSVRPLVDLVAKYRYIIVAVGGAALLCATPLLRVCREQRNARGRAATTRFIGLPLVGAAAAALAVAIHFGAGGGLDALRLSIGYTNTPVAVVVGATLLVLVRLYRSARNAAAAVVGDAARPPVVVAVVAGAALLYATPMLHVFREQRNARGRAAPAERATTTRFIGLPLVAAACALVFIGLPLVAAACALVVAIRFGASGGLDAFRLSIGYTNTPVAVVAGATLLVLVRFYRSARNAAAAVGDAARPPDAAPRARVASASAH